MSCSFWPQLVEKLMTKGCEGERWIPEYWIAYLVLQMNLYLLFSPAKLCSQLEYDTANMIPGCRTRQVLCLCVPFTLGFSPGCRVMGDHWGRKAYRGLLSGYGDWPVFAPPH